MALEAVDTILPETFNVPVIYSPVVVQTTTFDVPPIVKLALPLAV